jgi:hypothetical protein
MEKIKQIFASINPTIKLLLVAIIGYFTYRQIKKASDAKKLNDDLIKGSGQGLPTGGGITPMLNISLTLESIWQECFESVTENEEKIVSLIKAVPLGRMRDLALLYNKKVIDTKGNYHWWSFNFHIPTSFMEDMNYFLGSDISQVQLQLNSI